MTAAEKPDYVTGDSPEIVRRYLPVPPQPHVITGGLHCGDFYLQIHCPYLLDDPRGCAMVDARCADADCDHEDACPAAATDGEHCAVRHYVEAAGVEAVRWPEDMEFPARVDVQWAHDDVVEVVPWTADTWARRGARLFWTPSVEFDVEVHGDEGDDLILAEHLRQHLARTGYVPSLDGPTPEVDHG